MCEKGCILPETCNIFLFANDKDKIKKETKKKTKKNKQDKSKCAGNMQHFTAKWNGLEQVFELPCDCTFKDLQIAICQGFALTSCKITGLKPKLKQGKKYTFQQSSECEQQYDLLSEWFVLQPLQKLLIVGSKSSSCIVTAVDEEKKLKEQHEIYEEEIDYDEIIAMQKLEIEAKFQTTIIRENRRIRHEHIHATQNALAKAITLCHNGDDETLRRIWEPDFHDVIYQLAKCAVRNDKLNVLVFLKNKRRLSAQDYFKLFKKAAKYGHLQTVAFLFKEIEHDNVNGIKALENAISHGHLRLVRWIMRNCQDIIPHAAKPFTSCLNRACHKLYLRTITWVCNTFPEIVTQAHVTFTMQRPYDKEKCMQCIYVFLHHKSISWKQEDYNEFLEASVRNKNTPCLKLLLKKEGSHANVDHAAGNILQIAIYTASLEIVQEIVQEMQQLRFPERVWYKNVFSDEDFCKRFLMIAVKEHLTDIILYLFTTIALNITHLTTIAGILLNESSRSSQRNIKFFIDMLEAREEQERIAEFAATQVGHLFVSQFPVEINRIIIDYFLGVDGRHANQFHKEAVTFKQLIEAKPVADLQVIS